MTEWNDALRRAENCLPLERLGETLTAPEREHLGLCVRCQTEMRLWEEFRNGDTTAEERETVQAIAGQLSRSANVVSIGSWRNRRLLAVAAVVVLVAAIGYVVQNREPSIGVAIAERETYRSASVRAIAPTGDLTQAPIELRWEPVAGATRYDLQVAEVDRTILWRVSSREPRVALPAAVIAQFVPGKTILWDVTALRDATVMAESGTQRFRVMSNSR